MDYGTDNDADTARLVVAMREGRREAFSELVRRNEAAIFRLCLRIAGNIPDAEDLAHDAFVEAYLKLDQLREPHKFGAWMRTVALNVCRMWYRRSRQVSIVRLDDIGETEAAAWTPGSADARDESVQRIVAHRIWRLSAAHRLALVLYYWEGLSYDQLAAFLDVPVGTVMSRLHRARRALKKELEQDSLEEAVMPDEDFQNEIDAEIRALFAMFGEGPENTKPMARLSVILRRSPERFVPLVREATDSRTREDLAMLLHRLGRPAMEVAVECALTADQTTGARAGMLLERFVARERPTGGAAAHSASRGIYLLLDGIIGSRAERAAKVALLGELLEAADDERSALLVLNLLLCYSEEMLPLFLSRFWSAAGPNDLFKSPDILQGLCRTGTRFGRHLIPALESGDIPRKALAVAGAEALARGLNCRWLDLDSSPDERILVDARFRRKWVSPLHRDRDPAVIRALADSLACYLTDCNVQIRDAAVHALGLLGLPAHDTAIVACLRHPDRSTRVAALRALAERDDPRMEDLLLQAARRAGTEERIAAIQALARRRSPSARVLMAEISNDSDTGVRRRAAAALRKMDDCGAASNAVQRRPLVSLEGTLRELPNPGPYGEVALSRLIASTCYDFAATRRYLVDEGLMARPCGVYALTELGETAWRVERYIREHYGE